MSARAKVHREFADIPMGGVDCPAESLHDALHDQCRKEIAEFQRQINMHGDALVPIGWRQVGINLRRVMACGCVCVAVPVCER